MHKRKCIALICPACEYRDVVIDFFLQHIKMEHPEVSDTYPLYALPTSPFTQVLHCSVGSCGFRTTNTNFLDDHKFIVHGTTTHLEQLGRKPLRRYRSPPQPLPPTLRYIAAKFQQYRYIGWIEGEGRYVALFDRVPDWGLCFVEHDMARRGVAFNRTEGALARPPVKEHATPLSWPRVRITAMDTSTLPWTMAFTLTSQVAFERSEYSIVSSPPRYIAAKMVVLDPYSIP